MDIRVLGLARDLRTNTPVVYAQLPIEDYLEVVGEEFGNFTIQRRRENHKAYQRLKVDIAGGALLPSITLAVKPDKVGTIIPLFEQAEQNVAVYQDLAKALSTKGQVDILDGLQRTYIISDLKKDGIEFVPGQKIHVEFWLESDIDKLIYRIIILNAGQKPMSIRHQIELLFMSLKTSIEKQIPGLDIYTERENTRRTRAKKFALSAIVSAYQAFITGSAELQKGNVIAKELLDSNALDATEEEITGQFEDFTRWLTIYAGLDECVTRVYKSAAVPLEQVPVEDPEPTKSPSIHSGAYANWLSAENVIMAFFAAISQYGNSDPKKERVGEALKVLLAALNGAGEGDDPLGLDVFERLRVGTNPRRINVGLATRRLLTNGFKEFFRESGETPLAVCWPRAAD